MHTKFIKYFSSIAFVLMLLFFFLACSGNGGDDSSEESSSSVKEDSSSSKGKDSSSSSKGEEEDSSSSNGKDNSSSSGEGEDNSSSSGEGEDNSSSSDGDEDDSSSSAKQNNSSSSLEEPGSSSSEKQGSSSSSSLKEEVSSSSGKVQATTCANFVEYGSVPSNPYTACFRHTNNKCYVCDISSEGEHEGNVNTCESSWLWNNTANVESNLESGYWYYEVTCPAGVVSSSSVTTTPSSSSGGTPGTCKDNPTTKAEIDACIDANWQDYGGYTSRPNKVIALTFDDGPHNGTGTLLSALKTKNVKATFFVIGSNIRNNRTQAQAIYNDGHELGNHSDGYPSGAATTQSVNAGATEIQNITGSKPKVFRSPNLQTVQGLASTGFPDIWGCNTNDYTNGINTLTEVQKNGCAKDGGFLLMHESNTSNQNTVPRIGQIIDWLRSQGYWMLTVSQVAIYKGVTPVAGQRYNNF